MLRADGIVIGAQTALPAAGMLDPRIGAGTDFLTIFPGWNVWAVWQTKDLPILDPMMWGVSRDRQLRIWVEDAVRLHAPGAVVADPVDFKGGQVEILPSVPSGLFTSMRKEDVGGPSALLVDGPAELRAVRFFNRGSKAYLAWPHDDNYLLDAVYIPSPDIPATAGPPPVTLTSNITDPASAALDSVKFPLVALAVGAGIFLWLQAKK